MDAVGDGGDRHLLGVEARPQAREHLPADLAVEGGDAVGALGQAQAHDRHVEQVLAAAGVVLAAQLQDASGVDSGQFAAIAEVPRDELAVEAVDAQAGTGVWVVKTAPRADALQGGVEVGALGDEFADAFEAEESGVALVGVEDLGGAGWPVRRQ
ncbi:hypothetical protein GCM10020000_24710 [Streptomyces olivoverticillatus]